MTYSSDTRRVVVILREVFHLHWRVVRFVTGCSRQTQQRIIDYWNNFGSWEYNYLEPVRILHSRPRAISEAALNLVLELYRLKCSFYAYEIQTLIQQLLGEAVDLHVIYYWMHKLGLSRKRSFTVKQENKKEQTKQKTTHKKDSKRVQFSRANSILYFFGKQQSQNQSICVV